MEMTDFKPLFSGDIISDGPIVIAGPCSAENERQMLDTARDLRRAGIRIFRAGVWKPRTKPGGFEGIGEPALQWLAAVKERTGMLTATEVANHDHAVKAIASGVDVIWIGARTTANPFAVQEIADVLAGLPETRKDSLAVLVKNPVNPDLELWIGALERIYNAGVRRLGAIHRGFSAYGHHLYRNPPQWRIPIELKRRYPLLPILCDPSHIGGKRELVATLSQQALDVNFDGLIIESHCNPDCALSDKAQQITPDTLSLILGALVHRTGNSTSENLASLRRQIDGIDDELIDLLDRRMQVATEIGRYKKANGMAVVQAGRYNDLMRRRVADAVSRGMSADFIKAVLAAIHEESVRQQLEITEDNSEI